MATNQLSGVFKAIRLESFLKAQAKCTLGYLGFDLENHINLHTMYISMQSVAEHLFSLPEVGLMAPFKPKGSLRVSRSVEL